MQKFYVCVVFVVIGLFALPAFGSLEDSLGEGQLAGPIPAPNDCPSAQELSDVCIAALADQPFSSCDDLCHQEAEFEFWTEEEYDWVACRQYRSWTLDDTDPLWPASWPPGGGCCDDDPETPCHFACACQCQCGPGPCAPDVDDDCDTCLHGEFRVVAGAQEMCLRPGVTEEGDPGPDGGGWNTWVPVASLLDRDGDEVADDIDNCPIVENAGQADTDEDGVGDDCDGDIDGDGLTNDRETALGTDSTLADSDGDTLDDFAEVATHNTDPSLADTDGDGESDAAEVAAGTDPTGSSGDCEPCGDSSGCATASSAPPLGLTGVLVGLCLGLAAVIRRRRRKLVVSVR